MQRQQIDAIRWLASQLRAYNPETFVDPHLYRFFPREGEGPRVTTPEMRQAVLMAGAVIEFKPDASPDPILDSLLRQLLQDASKKIKTLQALKALGMGEPEMRKANCSAYLGISVFDRIQTEIDRPDVCTAGLNVLHKVANALDRRADRHEKPIGKARGRYHKPMTKKENEAYGLDSNGYKPAEAAKKLNIKVPTYRKRLRNAKKKANSM